MKKFWFNLNPCILALVAFPFLVTLAPDGLPFVHRIALAHNCNAQAGSCTSLSVTTCTSCASTTSENDNVTISSCVLTKAISTCTITATITFSITTNSSCNAVWDTYCLGDHTQQCASQDLAAQGPVTNVTRSRAVDCQHEGNELVIYLSGAGNCDCQTLVGDKVVFRGRALCELP